MPPSDAVPSATPPPSDAPPDGPALWDPLTRSAIEQYLRIGWLTAAGGGVALLMSALMMAGSGSSVPQSWQRPLVYGATFASILVIGGLGGAWRARQWRLLLAGTAWRAYQMVWIPTGRRLPRAALSLTPLDSAADPLLLRFGGFFRWRRALLMNASGTTVWLAGDPVEQAVLALARDRALFPARVLRTRRADRYREAAARIAAADPILLAERRVEAQHAYRMVQLRSALMWTVLVLLALARPTTATVAALAVYAVLFAITIVRARPSG